MKQDPIIYSVGCQSGWTFGLIFLKIILMQHTHIWDKIYSDILIFHRQALTIFGSLVGKLNEVQMYFLN